MERLKEKCIPDEWTVIYRGNCAMFLNIVNECMLVLQSSVSVFEDLCITPCVHGNFVKRIGNRVVQYGISDINDLFDILIKLQQISSDKASFDGTADLIKNLLEKIEQNVHDNRKDTVKFWGDKVLVEKERLQHSSHDVSFAANVLNNYCKQRNDVAAIEKAEAKARKLKALTSK